MWMSWKGTVYSVAVVVLLASGCGIDYVSGPDLDQPSQMQLIRVRLQNTAPPNRFAPSGVEVISLDYLIGGEPAREAPPELEPPVLGVLWGRGGFDWHAQHELAESYLWRTNMSLAASGVPMSALVVSIHWPSQGEFDARQVDSLKARSDSLVRVTVGWPFYGSGLEVTSWVVVPLARFSAGGPDMRHLVRVDSLLGVLDGVTSTSEVHARRQELASLRDEIRGVIGGIMGSGRHAGDLYAVWNAIEASCHALEVSMGTACGDCDGTPLALLAQFLGQVQALRTLWLRSTCVECWSYLAPPYLTATAGLGPCGR